MNIAMNSLRKSLYLSVFAVLALFAGTASAEACNPISTVPVTIDTPGTYCLTGDIVSSQAGYLITITSDNVTLDFKGYELRNTRSIGSGYGTQSVSGVVVLGSSTENTIVRNGRITHVDAGISVMNDSLVENMKIHDFAVTGISVGGSGALVRNNVLSKLVANTTLRSAIRISRCDHPVVSKGNRVIGNTIFNLIAPQNIEVYAVYNEGCDTVIEGNSIDGGRAWDSRYIGIFTIYNASSIAINNRFTGLGKSMKCWGSMSYKDNITYRSGANYCGQDLGGNI